MNRIRFRITFGFILIIVLLISTLGIYTGKLLENTYIETVSNRLEREAIIISKSINWNPGIYTNREKLNQLVSEWAKAAEARITIVSRDGIVLSDSEAKPQEMDNHLKRSEIRQALEESVGQSIRESKTTGIEMIYVAVPIHMENQVVGIVRLSYPINLIKSKVHSLWLGQLVGLFTALVLFSLLGSRIARNLTEPIERIIEVTRDITKQQFGKKVVVKGTDEIAELGRSINFMSDSLEQKVRAVQINERRLFDILQTMDSGIILVNQDGRILLANRAIKQILGLREEEIVGKLHIEATKNFGISQLIDRVIIRKEKIREEVHIYFPFEKILDIHLAPHFNEEGNLVSVVIVLHDISHIRRLEKIRSDFVANVSHELKTPVTSIKGFSETLLDGAMHDQETLKHFLQIIYQESDRLQRLINDVLDLSKIEQKRLPLERTFFSISHLTEELIAHFQEEFQNKNIHFEKNIPDRLFIEADWDRIKQIFINLVSNAIQYTPEGGKVWIEVIPKNDWVRIIIGDTGMGIPAKEVHRVFERFYRVDKARSRHSGGTGLGLAIVKHLVESHHGKISVESEEGKGSQFIIDLPLKQPK